MKNDCSPVDISGSVVQVSRWKVAIANQESSWCREKGTGNTNCDGVAGSGSEACDGRSCELSALICIDRRKRDRKSHGGDLSKGCTAADREGSGLCGTAALEGGHRLVAGECIGAGDGVVGRSIAPKRQRIRRPGCRCRGNRGCRCRRGCGGCRCGSILSLLGW